MSESVNTGRGPEEKIGEDQEQTTRAYPGSNTNAESSLKDRLSAPERAAQAPQQLMNSSVHHRSTNGKASTEQVSEMQMSAQDRQLEDEHEATEASKAHRKGESAGERARKQIHFEDDGDTNIGGADAINIKEVQGAIAFLTHTLGGNVYPVLKDAPKIDKQIALRAPQLRLLKLQFPKHGSLWTGGLVRWLRSAPVMQVVAMWVRECWQDAFVRHALEEFLPEGKFPWTSQHKSIVELAKRGDLRKPLTDPAKDVKTLCAVYGRKIFLCNREILIDNSPSDDEFLNYHLLDLPCAVILTAFHDLKAMGHRGFFVQMLKSPLVKPMHSDVRKKVEQTYTVDPSLTASPDNATRFYTPSTESFTISSASVESKKKIDQEADYNNEPFNDKEKLAFLTAYRDWPKSDPEGAVSTHINYAYIAEILPGRCVDEVEQHYLHNKAWLTKSATPLSKSALAGQKRGREDEDDEEDNTRSSKELKKDRDSLQEDGDDVQDSSTSQQARYIFNPKKRERANRVPTPDSERPKLSRSQFEIVFNKAPMIQKRHREIAAQRPRVQEASKAHHEAKMAVKEQQSKLEALSVAKMLHEKRLRLTMLKKWEIQQAKEVLTDREMDVIDAQWILDRMLMELETSRACCWRHHGDEAPADAEEGMARPGRSSTKANMATPAIEIGNAKAGGDGKSAAGSNAPDKPRHDKAGSVPNSKAAKRMEKGQQGGSGDAANLGVTEKTTNAPQTVEALMKKVEELEAENARLKKSKG